MNEPQMTQNSKGTKEWRLHGKLHREDAPATECVNGSKLWWLHGKLHREDGPAIEYSNGSKQWWLHGKLHREDGAAIEWSTGDKEWYLHNNHYASAEDWAEALLKQCNKPCDAYDVNAFLKQILKKNINQAL